VIAARVVHVFGPKCRGKARWVQLCAALPLLLSCGTDAVGIETCRDIEVARCDAALSCGLIDDAATCKRFARDHCLHGVAVETPSATQVNSCISTIESLGRCAKRNGRNSSIAECEADGSRELGNRPEDVCELVLEPELARDCRFLTPPEPEPEPEPDSEPEPSADGGSK
jgi:hypothetical protein